MKEEDQTYGSYSEAIPMDKLVKLTNAKLADHPDHNDDNIREYAEHVVKAELGPRALSSDNIVNALVEEILRNAKS